MQTVAGDGVTGIKRRRRDLSSDDVRNLATASGRGRLKEDLESSTWRRLVKASKENNLEKKVLDDEPPVKKLKFLITTPSSIPSPTPLKELTLPRDQNPPRDESKGKGIATEEPLKEIMPFMEEGGSVPKIPSFKSFVIPEGELTNEDVMVQLKEMK
ncbi:hypothetical protein Tco_1092503 [Tanacetum coccineum]|uniref:Uncharacterized protein n=1 Tax=Tanacetum coccineum TaxID=301880 RepID=A0ABQ5IAE6_9ASTR